MIPSDPKLLKMYVSVLFFEEFLVLIFSNDSKIILFFTDLTILQILGPLLGVRIILEHNRKQNQSWSPTS